MKLKDKNTIKMCDILKSVLIENDFIIPEADIFTLTEPNSNIPDVYILITANGGVKDTGEISDCILLLEINSRLINGKTVNKIEIESIMDNLSSIIENPIQKDNYTFLVSNDMNMFDDIDTSMGYATKMINILCRVNRI